MFEKGCPRGQPFFYKLNRALTKKVLPGLNVANVSGSVKLKILSTPNCILSGWAAFTVINAFHSVK